MQDYPPLVPPPKRLRNAVQLESERRTIRHDTPIPLPLTIHTSLFSVTQPVRFPHLHLSSPLPLLHTTRNPYYLTLSTPNSISSHTSPTHNTYILLLVSQPALISSHTPPKHNTYNLLLVCVPTTFNLLTYTLPLLSHFS